MLFSATLVSGGPALSVFNLASLELQYFAFVNIIQGCETVKVIILLRPFYA